MEVTIKDKSGSNEVYRRLTVNLRCFKKGFEDSLRFFGDKDARKKANSLFRFFLFGGENPVK